MLRDYDDDDYKNDEAYHRLQLACSKFKCPPWWGYIKRHWPSFTSSRRNKTTLPTTWLTLAPAFNFTWQICIFREKAHKYINTNRHNNRTNWLNWSQRNQHSKTNHRMWNAPRNLGCFICAKCLPQHPFQEKRESKWICTLFRRWSNASLT